MIIPAIILFIIGTMAGSFLSVVNYRIRHNKPAFYLVVPNAVIAEKN